MVNIKRIVLGVSMCVFVYVGTLSAQSEKQTAYGILIDNTGSLRTQLETEITAAKEVLQQTPEGSRYFLFGFATDPTSKVARAAIGAQCTSDRDLVKKQIDNLFTVSGQTTLIDAIKTASERMDSSKPANCSEFRERILVLITDGEDRASELSAKDLTAYLKGNGVKIYVIGLLQDLGQEAGFIGKSPQKKSKEFLETLAKETGGKIVFPKRKQTIPEVLKGFFEISEEVK